MLVTPSHPVLRLELYILFIHCVIWLCVTKLSLIYFCAWFPPSPLWSFVFGLTSVFKFVAYQRQRTIYILFFQKINNSFLEILQKVAMIYIENSCYSEADNNISVCVSPSPWRSLKFYSHITRNAARIGPGAADSGPILGVFCKVVRRVS
jgi:hypothetical protein